MLPKPKANSKLAQLPPHQREQLIRWLVDENISLAAAAERVEQDFNVRVSTEAVRRFYASQCFMLRTSEAHEFAEQVANELVTIDPDFDKATMALVKQKAFERAYARDGDIDQLATLARIIGDTRTHALRERRLEFDQEKFRQQIKDDIEVGLDALYSDVKDNPEAIELFKKMRAVIKSAGGKQ